MNEELLNLISETVDNLTIEVYSLKLQNKSFEELLLANSMLHPDTTAQMILGYAERLRESIPLIDKLKVLLLTEAGSDMIDCKKIALKEQVKLLQQMITSSDRLN